jgi:Ribosomally synthesized peptide prototyped by Frankia Franean1_4349.
MSELSPAPSSNETVIGRAIADPEFRQALVEDPEQALQDAGLQLDPDALRQLTSMSREDREQMADELDARQSASSYGIGALFGDTDSEIHPRE